MTMRSEGTEILRCLYSIEKTAFILDISPWTVRKWISEGRIETCKIGARRLIPSSEIARIISDATVKRKTNAVEGHVSSWLQDGSKAQINHSRAQKRRGASERKGLDTS